MLLNSIIVERGLNAAFEAAYNAVMERQDLQDVNGIMTTIRSTGSQETMGWLGDFPLVREWIGDRAVETLKDYKYVIRNKDWIVDFPINENELEDDQIGAVMPRAQMMGQRLAEFPLELVASLLVNGTSNLAYDGVAFFSNVSGVRTIDNLLAGTGSTLATIKADISTARATMARFTSDKGRALGLKMDTIVCPPEMEALFYEAVNSSSFVVTGEGGTMNPLGMWIKKIIALPELTDTTDWYGLATGYPLRPIIYQERRGVRSQLDDTTVKKNKTLVFQADIRGNAGYGLPQMALKVVNS